MLCDSRRAARCPCPGRSSTRRSLRRCSAIRRRSATARWWRNVSDTRSRRDTRAPTGRADRSAPEQLQYAEDDVRYLVPLYLDLRAALEARGTTRLAVRRDSRARTARPVSHRARRRVAQAQGPRSPATAAARDGEAARAMARSSGHQTRQAARLDSCRRSAARNRRTPARVHSRSRSDPQPAAGRRAQARRRVDGADRARPRRRGATRPPRATRRALSRSSWRS